MSTATIQMSLQDAEGQLATAQAQLATVLGEIASENATNKSTLDGLNAQRSPLVAQIGYFGAQLSAQSSVSQYMSAADAAGQLAAAQTALANLNASIATENARHAGVIGPLIVQRSALQGQIQLFSSQVNLNIDSISVSIQPVPDSVSVLGVVNFTATVKGDGSNSGVTWDLGSTFAPLGPGTLSNKTPTSVTYTAPAQALPSGAFGILLTATSVAAPQKSYQILFTID
jgi:hypothetical protein